MELIWGQKLNNFKEIKAAWAKKILDNPKAYSDLAVKSATEAIGTVYDQVEGANL